MKTGVFNLVIHASPRVASRNAPRKLAPNITMMTNPGWEGFRFAARAPKGHTTSMLNANAKKLATPSLAIGLEYTLVGGLIGVVRIKMTGLAATRTIMEINREYEMMGTLTDRVTFGAIGAASRQPLTSPEDLCRSYFELAERIVADPD